MKAYTFINSYIRGIQVGIQAGHSLVELLSANKDDKGVSEWASHHKTFVWLDGGDSDSMEYLIERAVDVGYPIGVFNEPGLGDLVTSFTIVLPENLSSILDDMRKYKLELGYNCLNYDNGLLRSTYEELGITRYEANFLLIIANTRTKSL